MKPSAYHKYNPSDHAEQYGWLWTENAYGELGWNMVFTIEDEDQLRIHFVDVDHAEDADDFAGQPFLPVSEPPSDGTEPPGYILTLDDHRGVRVTFSWGAEGVLNDDFADTIRTAIERAITDEGRA